MREQGGSESSLGLWGAGPAVGPGLAGLPAPSLQKALPITKPSALGKHLLRQGYAGGMVQRWHRAEMRSREAFASTEGWFVSGHGCGIMLAGHGALR